MGMGIPKYASASGGIYFYKDGRDVPDVWHVTLEYPDRDMTVLYSATLSSNNSRGNRIMGHDATMILGGQSNAGGVGGFSVEADRESTQYRERIEKGIINTKYPIYNYSPGSKQIDGVTSATSQYFANKGLLYAYRDGKRVILLIFILKIGLIALEKVDNQNVMLMLHSKRPLHAQWLLNLI